MKNGRMKDVIVEDVFETDERTGVRSLSTKKVTVWADVGLTEIIKVVEGVVNVYNFDHSKTEYTVYIDPRYSIEFVKAEIEAAILCKSEGG